MNRTAKNNWNEKMLSLFLALSLCLGLLPAQPLYAEEAERGAEAEEAAETIEIYSVEDLLALSENCYVDSWSEGKYISLKSDLNLSGVDFLPIPVFSGIFDGGGHTISGFNYMGDGYITGFFRYIGDTGIVRDLTLQGSVDSENEKECVGSICGVNYGEVKDCAFQGTVSGRDTVGGIAGINESTATISGCTVKGRVTGYYSTGGIAGINHGAVNSCTNYAGINDDSAWVWEDDEMGGLGILDSLVSYDDAELYSGVDTGGIAGFSDGILSGCSNEGTVGYEHTGYNIGGIAGRQSGIISLCVNKGNVYGRKDVGGIAGQMEPFIEIDEAESLRNAINKLHDLIEKTLDDMQKTKNAAKSDADAMQAYADSAIDIGDALASQVTEFADSNIDAFNSLTGRMEHVMDMLPPVLDYITMAGDGLSGLNDTVRSLTDALVIPGELEVSWQEETDYERLALLTTVGGTLTSDILSPGENDEVTVTVRADSGYRLKAGSFSVKDIDGDSVPVTRKSEDEYMFTMPRENVVVSAEFVSKGVFLVKSTVGGTVLATVDGDRETFRGMADSGYELSHFNVGGNRYQGAYAGDDNNEITLSQEEYLKDNASVVVEAVFVEKSESAYKINCVSSAGGSARLDKSSAAKDEEVTVTVAALPGYKLDEMTADGAEVRGSSSDADKYVFTMPGHDVTVKVSFAVEIDSDTGVYVESAVGGSAYKTPGSSDRYTINIIPADGYTLDSDRALEITAMSGSGTDGAGNPTASSEAASGTDGEKAGESPAGAGGLVDLDEKVSDGDSVKTVALSELTKENGAYKYVLDTKEFAEGNIRVYVNFVEEEGDSGAVDGNGGNTESGGGHAGSHAITTVSSTGGQVTTSLKNADEGEKVYVTPVSGRGYVLENLKVVGGGKEIPVTRESDGKGYSFLMPAEETKVMAQFEPVRIILVSNLSGDASCSGNMEGLATLKVKPDSRYTLEKAPVVTDRDGRTVPLSKKQSGSYVYEFDLTEAGAPYTVRIYFKKQDDRQAVDTSKDSIRNAIDGLEQASSDVENTADKIRDIAMAPNGSIKDWSQLTQEEKEELAQEVVKLAELLGNVTTSASSILSHFAALYNILSPYISDGFQDALDILNTVNYDVQVITDSLREATDKIQLTIDSLQAATESVRGIVNYINAQPDITFRKSDDDFHAAKQAFHDQLRGLSDSIRALNDHASINTELLNEDLRAVNDQLNVVFNLFADRAADIEELSIEELYEEVDDEHLDSITTGRVEACTNKGIVKGDINVGGIAGSMSIDDEDPEDSAAGKIKYEVGRRFITKCLVTDSANEGYVTAKKDGAGGICGYMNHGIIVESRGFGSVESTEGGYVGGICGESLTIIKRCYALCSVSGGSNVGGIAGYADTLQDCYAMASVEAKKGRSGAIAGQVAPYEETVSEEAKVSGNYYVGSGVYGIDNISYVGVAEPISYNELLAVEKLPLDFWHLKVVYRIEDTILGTQEVPYGVRLDSLDYPQIPDKEGFYGVWPDVSERIMEGTYVIQGEYKENVTVVTSDGGEEVNTTETVRVKPYALVMDIFTEDAVLNASVCSFAPPAAAEGKKNVVYDISLENSGIGENDSFAVRILNPYKKAVVYGYQDGCWTERESKVRGQYLQVEMTGTQAYFCVVEQTSERGMIAAGIAAGAAAAFAVLILLIRRVMAGRKERKRRKR